MTATSHFKFEQRLPVQGRSGSDAGLAVHTGYVYDLAENRHKGA